MSEPVLQQQVVASMSVGGHVAVWRGRLWAMFAVAVVLFTVATQLSAVSLWGALACPFSLHAAVCALPLLLAAVLVRRWWVVAVLTVCVGVLSAHTVSLWLERPGLVDGATRTLHVASANVLGYNRNLELAVSTAADLDADVLAIIEVTPPVEALLEGLRAEYPHQAVEPQTLNFGLAIVSRLPLRDVRAWTPEGTSVATMTARVEVDGAELLVVAAHLFPPVGVGAWQERNRYLRAMAEVVRGEPRVVLLGDLNAPGEDAAFRRLLTDGGLRDSRAGRGRFASWPAPLGLAGIVLDHILVGAGVQVDERRSGWIPGSDHDWVDARIRF